MPRRTAILLLGAPLLALLHRASGLAGAQPAPPGSAPSASAPAAPTMSALLFPGGQAAVFPPREPGPKPVAVFLHGMCASGALECPVFASAAGARWLLCPDGAVGCQGGGWMWASTEKATAERIQAATGALQASEGDRVSDGPRAIIGYSLGAPSALLQALREPGRYDRLMIVNASVEPPASSLKKAGVRRVALVSGARDATASKLTAHARRLERAGVEARYFALEATGHYFDEASPGRMTEPLGWLLGP